MITQFKRRTVWLILVSVLVVAGCQRRYEQDVLAHGPDVNSINITSDYAPRTIGATGGYQAWIDTIKLERDCVVTYYKPDGSFYLTEQHHEIYPWSNAIRISAQEPQGELVWQLSADGFKILQAGRAGMYEPGYEMQSVLRAVLDITTAPVRLLDSAGLIEGSEPVKVEGLWHHSIERAGGEVEPPLPKAVFYQDIDSGLVDMIWFADLGGRKFLAVRGYDYSRVGEQQVLVPAKIEVFRTDAKGLLQRRLVKIDLK
ncbi:MAG: hypothetical protein JSV99_03585 [Planctomycetota bacterium]|nr:MAG: hypothetical protein JSV99_03585 [Planctomycetota bacterium]